MYSFTHIDCFYARIGNRIISLELLGKYIYELTTHSATCGHPAEFLGESRRIGLCSVLTARCSKCLKLLKMHTSESSKLGDKCHYSCNIAAVLGLSRRSWSPATTGPPGPSAANYVAVDGPPDQVWLPWMVRFAASGPPVASRKNSGCSYK